MKKTKRSGTVLILGHEATASGDGWCALAGSDALTGSVALIVERRSEGYGAVAHCGGTTGIWHLSGPERKTPQGAADALRDVILVLAREAGA